MYFLNKEENSESSCQDSRVRSYNVRTTNMREASRDSLPNGLASLLQWRLLMSSQSHITRMATCKPQNKDLPQGTQAMYKIAMHSFPNLSLIMDFFITIIITLVKHWPNGHLITLL